jgi:hypothetical protein
MAIGRLTSERAGRSGPVALSDVLTKAVVGGAVGHRLYVDGFDWILISSPTAAWSGH